MNRKLIAPVVALLLTVTVMILQSCGSKTVLAKPPQCNLPVLVGWEHADFGASEVERNVLPKDTQIMRRRYRQGGNEINASIVISGKAKNSIHRPELCLPSQGFQMSTPKTLTAGQREWRMISLARGESTVARFAYTFANQEGFRTSSHISRIFRDVWDRSLFNRIDRWVMVTVYATIADEEQFRNLLSNFDEVVK